MKDIYKKLMEQHGGSIPFTILGGAKKKKTRRRRKPSRKTKKRKKATRGSLILDVYKYSPGTIIRKKGQLWKLTRSKKWIKI